MIKLISKQATKPTAKTKQMYQMQPLEVCVIVANGSYVGHVVMRSASQTKFEVMDLTYPRPDSCWTYRAELLVRELYPGETYTIELS